MQTIKPIKDYLFCKPADKQEKTVSGLILTGASIERPHIAEIINLGPDVERLKSGDKIIYNAFSTTELKLNDDDYLMLRESDCLGIVLEVEP